MCINPFHLPKPVSYTPWLPHLQMRKLTHGLPWLHHLSATKGRGGISGLELTSARAEPLHLKLVLTCILMLLSRHLSAICSVHPPRGVVVLGPELRSSYTPGKHCTTVHYFFSFENSINLQQSRLCQSLLTYLLIHTISSMWWQPFQAHCDLTRCATQVTVPWVHWSVIGFSSATPWYHFGFGQC